VLLGFICFWVVNWTIGHGMQVLVRGRAKEGEFINFQFLIKN